MSNNITIHTANVNDVFVVHQLINALENVTTNFDLFKDIYLNNLQQPSIVYLVAKVASKVVGFISAHGQLLLHHTGYVYEIQEFYVQAAYQGLGIGSALLNNLEVAVKNKSAVSLEVTAQKKRTQAHRFYIKNKFINTHLKFTKQL